MPRLTLLLVCFSCLALPALAQPRPETKFIADTLVVDAEGSFETDPDLATLKFDISSQEKELKRAYDTAAQSMERIQRLAERNGLDKADVSTGVFTVTPYYEHDHKNKVKSYTVHGQISIKLHDFSKVGPILDEAVQEGVVEFRSLSYSLRDEESAKERAVAEAMRKAGGRATAALAVNGQKVGPVRYVSVDVTQLLGVAQLQASDIMSLQQLGGVATYAERRSSPQAPPPPPPHPEKITVGARVQCAFQIQ